jgi:hypothetical protein
MAQYQGHQANGSGLQNHSIGGIYPYIIGYKPFSEEYYLTHSSGVIFKYSQSYDALYNLALKLKGSK